MSVSVEAFADMRHAASSAVAMRVPSVQPKGALPWRTTAHGQRWRAARWRVYFAIVCSVLVHGGLLWRADAGNVENVAVARPAPLAIRIMPVAAPLPVQTAPVTPAQARREPHAQTVPKPRPRPRVRQVDKPLPSPRRPESAPEISVQSSAAREPAAASAATQATASLTTAQARTAMAAELPLITEPRYRSPPPPPEYPPQSVRRNEEGTALIRARISPRGDVIEARVFASSGSMRLDKSALAAVRRWLFVAAVRNGQPSEAWVQVPVRFRLDE